MMARARPDVLRKRWSARLPPGQRQLVEIARACRSKSRAAHHGRADLQPDPTETERLFEVIADLQGSGVAVVYISHRLMEVNRSPTA